VTTVRINKAHYPVTTLGPGRRIGIWFQGCSISCSGCISRDTWDAGGGAEMMVPDLIAWCQAATKGEGIDGVTISGGEPFEQPYALKHLLDALNTWRKDAILEFDILCYSGLPMKKLESKHGGILRLIDVICPEPYVGKLHGIARWRGSTNQTLIGLSERGKEIVRKAEDMPAQKHFQLDVANGRVWFIGIPEKNDMERLERLAADRGLVLGDASWRA